MKILTSRRDRILSLRGDIRIRRNCRKPHLEWGEDYRTVATAEERLCRATVWAGRSSRLEIQVLSYWPGDAWTVGEVTLRIIEEYPKLVDVPFEEFVLEWARKIITVYDGGDAAAFRNLKKVGGYEFIRISQK